MSDTEAATINALYFSIPKPVDRFALEAFFRDRTTWLPMMGGWVGQYPLEPIRNQHTIDLQYITRNGALVTQSQIVGPLPYGSPAFILKRIKAFYDLAFCREEGLEREEQHADDLSLCRSGVLSWEEQVAMWEAQSEEPLPYTPCYSFDDRDFIDHEASAAEYEEYCASSILTY